MAGKISDLRWKDVEWPAVEAGTRVRVMAGNLFGKSGVVTEDHGASVTIRLDNDGGDDTIGKRWVNDIST